jgi:4-hydroxy-tetrahydrodipicolinate reductase
LASTGTDTIRVVSFGLGPIGGEIARVAAHRSGVEIVGAVDVDPAKVGRPLREVADADSDVVVSPCLDAALEGRAADALLHSTTSVLRSAWPQVAPAVERGLSIVSTCEELSYPWRTQGGLAREADHAARTSGSRIIGTGVNPGYVMDILPLVLTAPCQRVTRLAVERIVDAGARRGPLQRKVGAGLSAEEFDARVREGSVRHVGLTESAWMILDGLGWEPDEVREEIRPVLAERDVRLEGGTIPAGAVAGVRQRLEALRGGEELLSLDLAMYVGAESPRDRVCVYGVPDLGFVAAGGVHGDRATAAMVLNALPAVLRRPPGLLTMLDLITVRAG